MGAWGSGPFENDDACDWLYELEEGGLDLVRAALAAAGDDDYLEAPDGSVIVAAAELVAAMAGRPLTGGLPDEATGFVDAAGAPDPALVAAARAGVERVLAADSELLELWRDAESFPAWQARLADLRRRLSA